MKNISRTPLVRISLFAVLTAIGSYIILPLPFSPVPVSMQSFFIILSGIYLNPLNAFLSQLTYVLMGFAGLPVFSAGGSGPGFLLGPTGGYLFGFILVAPLVSLIAGKGKVGLAIVLGLLLVYLFGIPWLILHTGIGIKEAFFLGIFPFLPGDIIKGIAVILVMRRLPAPYNYRK